MYNLNFPIPVLAPWARRKPNETDGPFRQAALKNYEKIIVHLFGDVLSSLLWQCRRSYNADPPLDRFVIGPHCFHLLPLRRYAIRIDKIGVAVVSSKIGLRCRVTAYSFVVWHFSSDPTRNRPDSFDRATYGIKQIRQNFEKPDWLDAYNGYSIFYVYFYLL